MVGMVWYGMVWHDLLPCGLLHAGGPHQAGPQQSYREVQAAGGGDGEWIDLRSAARGNYLKSPELLNSNVYLFQKLQNISVDYFCCIKNLHVPPKGCPDPLHL